MITQKIFQDVRENIQAVIEQTTQVGKALWAQFIELHPADIAQFLSDSSKEDVQGMFLKFKPELKVQVFVELSPSLQEYVLSFLSDHERVAVLSDMPIDELTDLFDELSDEDFEAYMTLLRKKDRDQIISLMKFNPDSAGGIMEINVWSLFKDLTVEKAVQLLRRLKPNMELYRVIYLTTRDNLLVGHIMLEDLIVQNPKRLLGDIAQKNELVIRADQDQEDVANEMLHYGVSEAPVVGVDNKFLGVISSEVLAEVIEEEATEDVYKMSAVKPIKQTYFETPFFRLLYERGYILVILLLAESVSGVILRSFESTITGILVLFIPMLMSTGGNTSHQTSALVIRGMSSGEVNESNMGRFLRREFLMAGMLALMLGATAFFRVYFFTSPDPARNHLLVSFIVSLACALVIMTSVTLGSGMPIVLKKLRIDPMFSAGPVLATLMDVLAVLIFCYVSRLLLY